MKRTFSNELRRPKAHLSSYIINYLCERNPWQMVWWSASFPGMGHMMLCKYFSGSILMTWEFFVNVKAHINEAIFYSMIGQFQIAKEVIDTRWFLLYMTVYIFTMWDSYCITIDLNKYSALSDRVDSPIMPFNISPLEVHYLEIRKPWSGVFWGFLNPGLGSIYANRLPMGFFVLICFILTVYHSNVLPAIHFTFEGKFDLVKTAINHQWFLNLPSLMLFAVSAGFNDIYYTNQLFKIEQSRYLTDKYQLRQFNMPNKKKGNSMHFISSFQHSAFLELALSDLEQKGISKENIFVAPLDKSSAVLSDVEKAHREGASKYELSFIFGNVFMLLGGIYGFIFAWGPIIWSLIGLVFGATLGIVISLFTMKLKWFREKSKSEVVLIVECEKEQSELVERILWRHNALGVSKT